MHAARATEAFISWSHTDHFINYDLTTVKIHIQVRIQDVTIADLTLNLTLAVNFDPRP